MRTKGVEAAAVLKVRLGNVAAIIDRVMTTIDHNPQILADLTRGLPGLEKTRISDPSLPGRSGRTHERRGPRPGTA